MNFFKLSFFAVLFVFTSIVILNIYFLSSKSNFINPSSQHNDFVNQLNFALASGGFKPIDVKLRQYQNEIDINLKIEDKPQTIIFSTQKNPFWQVSSLQKIQKLAKIRDKHVNLIDLSQNLPYATLQDN